jgi:hypothetical protein
MSLPPPMAAAAIAAGVLGHNGSGPPVAAPPGPAYPAREWAGSAEDAGRDRAGASTGWPDWAGAGELGPLGAGLDGTGANGLPAGIGDEVDGAFGPWQSPERVLAPTPGRRPAGQPGQDGWGSGGMGSVAPAWPLGPAGSWSGSSAGGAASGGNWGAAAAFAGGVAGGAASAGATGSAGGALAGVSRAEGDRLVSSGLDVDVPPPADEPPEQDLERLADEVYDLLRWRLAGERERLAE